VSRSILILRKLSIFDDGALEVDTESHRQYYITKIFNITGMGSPCIREYDR